MILGPLMPKIKFGRKLTISPTKDDVEDEDDEVIEVVEVVEHVQEASPKIVIKEDVEVRSVLTIYIVLS